MRYYDVYFVDRPEESMGYSIFVEAENEEEALAKTLDEDNKCFFKTISEISKEDYYADKIF